MSDPLCNILPHRIKNSECSQLQNMQRCPREKKRGLERESVFTWEQVLFNANRHFPKSFNDSVSLTLYTRNINRNDNFYSTRGKSKNRMQCQVSLFVQFFKKAITWQSYRTITGHKGYLHSTLMPKVKAFLQSL